MSEKKSNGQKHKAHSEKLRDSCFVCGKMSLWKIVVDN